MLLETVYIYAKVSYYYYMDDCLIISVFNDGVYELALNHLTSLRNQGIENYMAFTTGKKSYTLLAEKGFNVSLIEGIEDYNDEFSFTSSEFGMFSYIRYKIIMMLFDKYKYIWYLDVDTVVLGDINKEIDRNVEWDLLIQDDIQMPCTGCMLFRTSDSSKKTIKKVWELRKSNMTCQMAFFKHIQNKMISIKITILSKYKFVSGGFYFDNDEICTIDDNTRTKREDMRKYMSNNESPLFVHANFMVGNDKKIAAFKRHGLWFIDNIE